MSKGWKRYGEGRLYFIGGSIGLMVVLWSVLFAHDHAALESQADALAAIEAPASGSVSSQPAPVPAEAPQTRTRGS